jgi:hypothetical protein
MLPGTRVRINAKTAKSVMMLDLNTDGVPCDALVRNLPVLCERGGQTHGAKRVQRSVTFGAKSDIPKFKDRRGSKKIEKST